MSASEDYHPSLDDPNAWVPYRYHPNLAAAIIFIILLSLATIFHAAQVFRRKTWYFTPFVIGGILELGGYVGRAVSTSDLWALGPYIVQSIFLLVAPALFAASIYIVLGRIIRFVDGEQYSVIKLKWLTKLFVCGDVLAFLTQMGGGGIQAAGTLSMLKTGEKIIIVGLFLQIAFFGIFCVVATVFHVRFTRHAAAMLPPSRTIWRRHQYALYWGSGLIMVRSLFRVTEYLMGNNGFLLRHEYFLYVFDAVLMLALMVLFMWIHPSELNQVAALAEQRFPMEPSSLGSAGRNVEHENLKQSSSLWKRREHLRIFSTDRTT